MEKATFERIYEVVKQIPYGKVATYGQVAECIWININGIKLRWI